MYEYMNMNKMSVSNILLNRKVLLVFGIVVGLFLSLAVSLSNGGNQLNNRFGNLVLSFISYPSGVNGYRSSQLIAIQSVNSNHPLQPVNPNHLSQPDMKPISVEEDTGSKDCINVDPEITMVQPHSIVAGLPNTSSGIIYVFVHNLDDDSCPQTLFRLKVSGDEDLFPESYVTNGLISPNELYRFVVPVHTSTTAGEHEISIFVDRNINGNLMHTVKTFTLTLSPSQPASLVLSPEDTSMSIGSSQVLRVHVYDEFNNEINDISDIEWNVLGDYTEGVDYDIDTVENNGLEFTPHVIGNYTITASYVVNSTLNLTADAVIHVSYPDCIHQLPDISISPISEELISGGSYQTNITLTDVDDAWCDNATYNISVDVPDDGSSSPERFNVMLSPGENSTATFMISSPTIAGDYNVTYSVDVIGSDLSENISQPLTVTSGLPAELVVDKTPNIDTLPAGQIIKYHIHVYDEDHNEVTGYLTDWSVSGENDEIRESNESYAKISFRTAGTTGTGDDTSATIVTINVTKDDTSLVYQDTLTVLPGMIDHIVITPEHADIDVNDVIDFNATLYDRYGNVINDSSYLDDIEWGADGGSIDANGIFSSNSPSAPGVFNITATIDFNTYMDNYLYDKFNPFSYSITAPYEHGFINPIIGYATVNVTVPDVENINVAPNPLNIGITQTADVEAHVMLVGGGEFITPLDWSVVPSSLGSIAIINDTNIVFTPLTGGDGNITVTEPLSGEYAIVPVHVDAVNPVITFVDPTPTDGAGARSPVTVNVTVDENTSSVLLEVDGLANLTMTDMGDNVYSLTRDYPLGVHTIRVYATDLYDNTASLGPRTFTVHDNLLPEITLVSPANGSDIYYGDIIIFDIIDDTGISASRYKWDDSAWDSFISDYNISVPNTLAQGIHNLTIEVTDDDSTVSTEMFVFNFNDYPNIMLNSPANGSDVDDSSVIDLDITDDDSIYATYQVGGSPLYVLSSPYDINISDVSEYMSHVGLTSVNVTAEDTDGFITTEVFWFNYTTNVDNPPVIELLPPIENNSYVSPGTVIQINVTDDYGFTPYGYATYQWDSDTPMYVSGTELDSNPIINIDTAGMTGTHTLTVYALDNSSQSTTEVYRFTVSSAPVITLISPSDGDNITIGDVIVLDIIDDGTLTTTEWVWDDPTGYAPFIVDYNITVPSLGSGEHTLYIRAVDDTSLETEVNYTFTYLEHPMITLVSPANGTHVDDGSVIDLDITDDGSIEFAGYKWNDGPEFVLDDPWDILVDYDYMLPDENNLTVRARDNDGLWTTKTFVFYGNNTLPTLSFDPINGSVTTDAGQEITISMSDSTGLANITYICPSDSANTTDLEGNLTAMMSFTCDWAPGVNTVPVTVTDIDGGHTDYDYVLIYDADGPVITLISPVEDSNISEGDTIILNITDADTDVDTAQYKWDDGSLQDFTTEWNITVPLLEAGEHNITVEANDTEGNPSTRTFTFNVPPSKGDIDGYVYDLFGSPISDANITVDGTVWNATTNGSGYFIIYNVTEGIYNITASADSYESQTRTGIGVVGGDTTHLNYYLIQYGSVNGTVTDWFFNPIDDANITVYEAGTTNVIATGVTDVDGTYQIDNILPGWYDIEADASGYVALTYTDRLITAGEVATVDFALDTP